MIEALIQFFVAFGASQFALDFYRSVTRDSECGHVWGKGHKVENSTRLALRHEWRKCKRCGAVQERYKLARRGSWHLTTPIPADAILPSTRVVER